MNRFTVSPCEPWAVTVSGYRAPNRPNHIGVDKGTPNNSVHPIYGARVFAPWDGKVETGYQHGGAGNWIWVTANDGTLFKCFHLSNYKVRSGSVKAGDVIGFVGNTGKSDGAHYHVEVWVNGRAVDPAPFFYLIPTPPPPPPPKDDDMAYNDWPQTDKDALVKDVADKINWASFMQFAKLVEIQAEIHGKKVVWDQGVPELVDP